VVGAVRWVTPGAVGGGRWRGSSGLHLHAYLGAACPRIGGGFTRRLMSWRGRRPRPSTALGLWLTAPSDSLVDQATYRFVRYANDLWS
jgi:hypothetical protein